MPRSILADLAVQGLRNSGNNPMPFRKSALPGVDQFDIEGQPPEVQADLINHTLRNDFRQRFANESDPILSQKWARNAALYDDEIDESPLRAQQAEVDETNAGIRSSIEQGYGGGWDVDSKTYHNPLQERNITQEAYRKEIGRQPMAMEALRGSNELAKQKLSNEGDLAVAHQYGDNGQDSFSELLKGAPGQNIKSMTFPSRYGGGSVSFQSDNGENIPAALANRLSDTQRRYSVAEQANKGGFGNWLKSQVGMDVGASPEMKSAGADRDQAITNVLSRFVTPTNSQIVSYVGDILRSSRHGSKPLEQILAEQGEDSWTPEEIAEAKRILVQTRGFE